jgi:hypothetical protein
LDEGVPVTWPLPSVDPRVSLATSIAGSPAGVYAVLIGSGMSSAAGIPTGWGVVQDLVRRVAQAEGVDPDELGDEPEAWWTRTYGAEPRYDALMEQLAPTDGARQALLRTYFDPPPTSDGPVLPTEGHRRLARMVAKGLIRVIITTNFDRLIERALDEVGISPQVVSVPEHVASMMPLVHAPATVLKLHGDYASLQLRNTREELANYPEPWKVLLGRIFDEYGLLVVGWSADSDVALAEVLAATPSRRFPIFWAARGDVSEAARRLIAGRRAIAMTIEDADTLFVDLTDRLDRLAAAARRRGPVRFGHVVFFPPAGTVQTGWTHVPLLQLRAGIQIGPAAGDSVEPIDIPDRIRLVRALNAAALTEQLRVLAAVWTPSAAAIEPAATGQHSLDAWHTPDDSDQTTLLATYRLGGPQTSGVGALVNIRMPDPLHGAALTITVDVGLTVAEQLDLSMVAVLLRDALLAAAVDVGAALGELLPPDATVMHVECHVDASTDDGLGFSRLNGIEQRLVWPWPRPANRPLTTLRVAADVQASFGGADAADVVERGLRLMLLNAGVLDPDPMVDAIHQALRATP